jgi:hypothetical protein
MGVEPIEPRMGPDRYLKRPAPAVPWAILPPTWRAVYCPKGQCPAGVKFGSIVTASRTLSGEPQMKPSTATTTSLTEACRAIVLRACYALAALGQRSARQIGRARRPARRIRLACLLVAGSLLVFAPAQGHAAGIECPVAVPDVPDLLGNEPQFRLNSTGSSIDLGNEIDYLINKLQIERPNISSAELTNVLIAAYCSEVAFRS